MNIGETDRVKIERYRRYYRYHRHFTLKISISHLITSRFYSTD